MHNHASRSFSDVFVVAPPQPPQTVALGTHNRETNALPMQEASPPPRTVLHAYLIPRSTVTPLPLPRREHSKQIKFFGNPTHLLKVKPNQPQPLLDLSEKAVFTVSATLKHEDMVSVRMRTRT